MSLMLGEHGGKVKPLMELQTSNQQLSVLYHGFETHNLNVSAPFLCESSRISVFPQEADLRARGRQSRGKKILSGQTLLAFLLGFVSVITEPWLRLKCDISIIYNRVLQLKLQFWRLTPVHNFWQFFVLVFQRVLYFKWVFFSYLFACNVNVVPFSFPTPK